nr:hypothetical protein [Halomicroarcula sp. GDY20]
MAVDAAENFVRKICFPSKVPGGDSVVIILSLILIAGWETLLEQVVKKNTSTSVVEIFLFDVSELYFCPC